MFDDSSSPAHWWPDGLAQDNLASRAFTDPAQQPLSVVHMNEGFIDFEQAVDLLGNSCDGAGGFDVNSDQAFCDVLDAYIWPSNESLDGLLRDQDEFIGDKVNSSLDDMMGDTQMTSMDDLLTAQPIEVPQPQEMAMPPAALHSNPSQLQGPAVDLSAVSVELSTRAAPSDAMPTSSLLPPSPSGEGSDASGNTSSQESSEPSKLLGVRKVIRKVRSTHSSRSVLAAEGIDRRQAGVAAQQREQAHSLEQQRQQMKHQRAELQAQQAELQAQQAQLQRDYLAMQAGSVAQTPLTPYPGRSTCPPFSMGARLDPDAKLGPHCYPNGSLKLGTSPAFGDVTASGASGHSRDTQHSGQFTYAASQQESGQMSGDYTPSGTCAVATSQQHLQQQHVGVAAMVLSKSEGTQQPVAGYRAGGTPDGDTEMGWQPHSQSQFFSQNTSCLPAYPGKVAVMSGGGSAPPTEASMLGELKTLIGQLDQQTKSTMQDSLYRISRHAQGGMCPKVQQSAVAQCAAPVAGLNVTDDIGPFDRAVADLLYTGPAQRLQPFGRSFGAAAGKLNQAGPVPTASEGSAHGSHLITVSSGMAKGSAGV